MQIIKGYWSNNDEGEKSESQMKDHLKNNEIKNVFVGYKKINNFKISTDKEGKFILRYALRKNASLKYYCNLLAQSAAVKNNTIVFLWDANWSDFKNRVINEKTINLLNN